MNISSLVVRARPDQVSSVQAAIEAIPGAEVHGASLEGKMVVTLEGEYRKSLADAITKMHNIPGVLSASMVFEQTVTDSENREKQE